MLHKPLMRHRGANGWPESFRDEMDRLFGSTGPWSGEGEEDLTAAYPVDVREDEKNLYVEAELPGFKKEEVSVDIENGVLSITAERQQEKEEGKKDERHHLHERRFSRVRRRFRLPAEVEESGADARLEEGVLKLTLKKASEPAGRKITVK